MGDITICNRALALLGANKITSLADEVQEAKVINNVISYCIAHFFSFALRYGIKKVSVKHKFFHNHSPST